MGFFDKIPFFKKKETVDENVSFTEDFRKLVKNAVEIKFARSEPGGLVSDSSKFGGKPCLPENFEWPYFEGTDIEGQTRARPLNFLLQVNCADLKEFDKEHKLPEKGMLCFFYELSSMPWGFNPKDKGSSRVYYFEDPQTLSKTDFPADMREEDKLPELKVSFSSNEDLPCFEEYGGASEARHWDKYDSQRMSYLGREKDEEREVSKILGYADLIQGEMLLECEAVTNGHYCGDGFKMDKKTKSELEKRAGEWTLLLQLSTVSEGDFELMFGDCGKIFYYIKKGDLADKKFDNGWLILQCH